MTAYRLPTFIVLEIPSPISGAIQAIRDSLATPTARLPVEITVAGSSGVGPILPGADKNETETLLKSVLPKLKPFPARFHEIRRFPNTNIFYLAPHDRQTFDQIHATLKTSGIKFAASPWPYNPHCTLRGGPLNDNASADQILSLSFPKQDFIINTLSIYEFDPRTVICHSSFQAKLQFNS
jgi:2'-5' RNA ligase